QTRPPDEIIVVDASPDDRSSSLVATKFPDVTYLRNPRGPGSTATSRHIGLGRVGSDIIAFLDDDAFAHPTWLEQLLPPYAAPDVGGVGGRALNGEPGEERQGVDRIGLLCPDGTMTGNFAADPGRDIEVDHLLGANMSFRTDALRALGGIRDGYPGTCLREETDLCLRVRSAGWRLVFAPASVVDHEAGPYRKGRRFDFRYVYFAQRNHLVLLIRNFGLTSSIVRRNLGVTRREMIRQMQIVVRAPIQLRSRGVARTLRAMAGAASRMLAMIAGIVSGLGAGWWLERRDRTSHVLPAPTTGVDRVPPRSP
ncbi:MAG TPA: glycosyltransferase, partial [Acidimicrobiales bacterium]|nr:glycosyltransferase [Acidimicrobiales bacterium]